MGMQIPTNQGGIMDIQTLKGSLQESITHAKNMHKLDPTNKYWLGKVAGINCTASLIMLAEAGESFDVAGSDLMDACHG